MTSIIFMFILLLGTLSLAVAKNKNYVVEVDLVFDKKALDNLKLLLDDPVAYIFTENIPLLNQVNKYFESVQYYGVNIEVRTRQIRFVNDDIFTDKDDIRENTYLVVNKTIPNVKEWLKKQDNANTSDLIVFLTGYPLWTVSKQIQGTSLGEVCTGVDSLTMVSYVGLQTTAYIMAHEIGHSLGIKKHDEDYDIELNEYIMDTTPDPQDRHRWQFSYASANVFKAALSSMDKKGNNCLTKTTTRQLKIDLKDYRRNGVVGPMIFERSKICKRSLRDVNALFCKQPKSDGKIIDRGDALCQTMYCRKRFICQAVAPTEGMSCADGSDYDFSKICKKGKCVLDT